MSEQNVQVRRTSSKIRLSRRLSNVSKKLSTLSEHQDFQFLAACNLAGNAKNLVIGQGKMGMALKQGLEGSGVKVCSARWFCELDDDDMSKLFSGLTCIVYAGYGLRHHAVKIGNALVDAKTRSNTSGQLEFLDFSNPAPQGWDSDDVGGTLELENHLAKLGNNENPTIKVFKVTQLSQLEVANVEVPTKGWVYQGLHADGVKHVAKTPKTLFPGVDWESCDDMDLKREVRDRIFDQVTVNRWWDAFAWSMACLAFTFIYAFCRYSENVNGSYGMSMVPMYILDKAIAWTALWLMVFSPFAGNVLTLKLMLSNFGKYGPFKKCMTAVFALLMVFPCLEFAPVILIMVAYYCFRAKSRGMEGRMLHCMVIDLVTLKGETGCVGCAFALVHSFLGCIICVPAYKTTWWKDDGRLLAQMEVSMMTGALATIILCAVGMRSLFGHGTWIILKPCYAYLSPIGNWIATVHVITFGYNGWYKLFDPAYHNGHPSITFVSSMFPTCILLAWHLKQMFGLAELPAKFDRNSCNEWGFKLYQEVSASPGDPAMDSPQSPIPAVSASPGAPAMDSPQSPIPAPASAPASAPGSAPAPALVDFHLVI